MVVVIPVYTIPAEYPASLANTGLALVVMGIMRVNKFKVIAVMAVGKFFRYAFIAASYYGITSLF